MCLSNVPKYSKCHVVQKRGTLYLFFYSMLPHRFPMGTSTKTDSWQTEGKKVQVGAPKRTGRMSLRRDVSCRHVAGRDERLAPALVPADGRAGRWRVTLPARWRDTVSLSASAAPRRDFGRAATFGRQSAHGGPRLKGMKNSSWARDESKTSRTPDAGRTVRGQTVAAFQTWSESMKRSPSEIGLGIWAEYLGEIKVRAHQKVQIN